jgi:hypothetical protein
MNFSKMPILTRHILVEHIMIVSLSIEALPLPAEISNLSSPGLSLARLLQVIGSCRKPPKPPESFEESISRVIKTATREITYAG